jgi:hypothetical protein
MKLKEELGKAKIIITDLETKFKESNKIEIEKETQIPVNPPPKPPDINLLLLAKEKEIMNKMNEKFMIDEKNYRSCIEFISRNKIQIENELIKKTNLLKKINEALEVYDENEIHYRSLLKLYNSKIERLDKIINEKTKDLLIDLLEEDYTDLRLANNHLLEILNSKPLIKLQIDCME